MCAKVRKKLFSTIAKEEVIFLRQTLKPSHKESGTDILQSKRQKLKDSANAPSI